MTSGEGSTQAGLEQFDSESEDRPEAEARAIAGNGDGSHAVVDPADERYPDAERRIDVAVTQVDYTLTGSGREERPILHVFGRTGEDGREREHVRVHEFRPYFYAPTDSIDEADLTDVDAITGWEETNDDDEPHESIRGERLTKIFGRTPRDVGEIRDRFDHFEADILFPNRFLIDKDVNSGISVPERRSDDGAIDIPHEEVEPVEATADLRVLTFDIEVDDRRGFPEDGEEPIVCLSSHDSYHDEYIAWLYNAPDGEAPPPEDVDNHDLLDDDASVEVRAFESEEGMLSAFIDYVEKTDPDLKTGWNFEDFDAPYLIDRLEVLGLDADRLSRVEEVWSGGYGGPNIKGRVVFDLLYAYQRTKFTELDSYRLDDVAEMELGVGKERYPGDIGDLWEDDPKRLLEYNVRDVELCVELDRKQEIIAFWDEARKIVGCKIEDATTPGDAVDMYVLHEAHGEFALPSKGRQETEEFEGGAVFDPITGVKEMVSVLDLKCFSGDTELLTPEGAKNITDVEPGDPIYTLNPDTFECEVTSVAETHEYDNQYGELHHISGNTHDFKITGNHRLLVSNERGWDGQMPGDFEFAEYRDLTETERYAFPQHEPIRGDTPETFDFIEEAKGGNVVIYYDDDLRAFRNRMPDAVTDSLDLIHGSSEAMGIQKKIGKYLIPTEVYREHRDIIDSHADGLFLKYGAGHRETPFSFKMADWLEFLGWFVTEGSIDRSANRVTIHQQEETHREAIRELLDRMGINHSASTPGIYVSNQFLFDWLEENCGAGYANKHLPAWVFDLDAELLNVLLDTMIRGDGSRADSGLGKFWTKSDQLKDDIVDLAVRCGEKPTVSNQSDGTWYVSIGKRGSFQKESNATVENHDGTVYCVTAQQNHVVLAGRNGHFQWIGQSLYPMSMTTINASPETQVDPELYDGETYQTPTGIHFRKEPDGIIREMVDELLNEREEKKALRNDHDPGSSEYERYDRQQAAVKVIMNSLYGVFGWDRFRLYDREMSAGVTSTNREVIEFTERAANELDKDVIYGDSVTGDRPVVVRDPIGQVRIRPIRELFEQAESEAVIAADGASAGRADLPKKRRTLTGWDALSMNDDGNAEWQPIKEVLRHETDEPVVRLQHKFGESTTTRHHSYVVEDGGDFVESPPEDVDEPLRIPGIPEVGTVETVDMYDVLDGYTREYEDGRSVGAENAVTKTKHVHADENWVWFGHEHHGGIDSTVKLRREIDLTTDVGRSLIRLLGAYITEGSASTIETTESKFGASIAESRYEWLEGLQQDYHRLFENSTAGIVASDSGGGRTLSYGEDGEREVTYDDETMKLQMMNELAAVFFREFAGQTSRGKRIPSFVFHLPEEQQNLFLDTLIEGDGSREFPRYSEAYAERNFDFETTSRELAAGLSTLLTQRGKKHSLKYRDAKDSYTIRTVDYYRGGRDPILTERDHDGHVYDLSVAANENFVDAVGGLVLHNTDSVMLELGGETSKQDAIERSFEIEEHINDRYDEFAREELNAATHRFQIEFEKLYRRFFQAGKKKRYAGHIIWKEGKDVDDIDITGFEYQRSDIAPITKEVQRKVLEMIVTGENTETVTEYVHDVIERFQEGDADLEEIGVPGGIGKRLNNYETDTAQVRGAKYANLLLGTNFGRGSKPKRLYLEKVHPDFWKRFEAENPDVIDDPLYLDFKRDPDVICFQYADQVPEEFQVDYDEMLEKTLKGPIARVIEALGMSWDEVASGQEQTGLGSFM